MISTTIHRLDHLLNMIPGILEKIPEAEFTAQVAHGKWSKKQILGHLIDSAANNHQRFIRVQYESIPSISYHADQWEVLNGYQYLSVQHVIQFWTIYNQHLLEVIKNIKPEQLNKLCNTGGPQPVTLAWLIEDYVKHMEHHLNQITSY